MSRPIHADAEATRGRILTAARKLFSERGIGSTSMRMIAKEAGVSAAMVHHYFGSKVDLYQASVEGMYQELRELQAELRAATVLVKHFTHLLPYASNPETALAHFHEFLGQLFARSHWPDELASLERPGVLNALAQLLGVRPWPQKAK